MLIIGMTGGIASGKSAVSFVLKKFGAQVMDIDEVTHELLMPGGALFEIYIRHFGGYIVSANGQLNKKLIGEIIFNHADERAWINSVAHPILLNHTRDFLVNCANLGCGLAVVEVPLLFEAGWEFLFDEIWAVHIPRAKQIWRLCQRDRITYQQAITRVNAQMPVEEICRRADVVINNQKSRANIQRQVKRALKGRFVHNRGGIAFV